MNFVQKLCLSLFAMQKGGSFNLQAVKEELDKKMAAHAAQ